METQIIESVNTIFNTTKKMKTNLSVELVKVTPSLAENYLKFNNRNRKPAEKHSIFIK